MTVYDEWYSDNYNGQQYVDLMLNSTAIGYFDGLCNEALNDFHRAVMAKEYSKLDGIINCIDEAIADSYEDCRQEYRNRFDEEVALCEIERQKEWPDAEVEVEVEEAVAA